MATRLLLFVLLCMTVRVYAGGHAASKDNWQTADHSEIARVSSSLTHLDAAFRSGAYGNIDEFLLIKDRKVYAHFRYKVDYRSRFEAKDTDEAVVPAGPDYTFRDSFPYNYVHPDWHPYYMGSDFHTLQSITKSIVSVLVGIAIERKELPGVDVSVVDSLASRYSIPHRDPLFETATLRHLLSMRLNLQWRSDLPFDHPDNPDTGIERSDDWSQYTLDLPMEAEPGTSFRYNSGATQLIGAMLREATGVDIEEYARRHLFKPLGIERFYWKHTPSGASDALGGLYLRSTDLAKIGQLMMDRGVWDGRRVVSEGWVKESLSPITQDASGTGASAYAYGYQWWLPFNAFGSGAFEGLGYGGQSLLCLPEHNIIVVLYSWNPQYEFPEPEKSLQPMLREWLASEIIPLLAN